MTTFNYAVGSRSYVKMDVKPELVNDVMSWKILLAHPDYPLSLSKFAEVASSSRA